LTRESGSPSLGRGRGTVPDRILLVGTVITQTVLVILAWFTWQTFKLPVPWTGTFPLRWPPVLTGAALAAVGAMAVWLLYRLWPAFANSTGRSVIPIFRGMSWPTLAVVSVFSAIGEEVFFRATLQSILGIGWAALLFTLLHVGVRRELWGYGMVVLVLGVGLGYLYAVTGSLVAVIVAHSLYNLTIGGLIITGGFDPDNP